MAFAGRISWTQFGVRAMSLAVKLVADKYVEVRSTPMVPLPVARILVKSSTPIRIRMVLFSAAYRSTSLSWPV